jgi:hypothetical protein
MTDIQLMILIRLNVTTNVVSVTFDQVGDTQLQVGFFDYGGNYHCRQYGPGGRERTIE